MSSIRLNEKSDERTERQKSIGYDVSSPLPQMMTIREIAKTGLLPEAALRRLLKQGKLPAAFIGKKALINYEKLCNDLQNIRHE